MSPYFRENFQLDTFGAGGHPRLPHRAVNSILFGIESAFLAALGG